MASDREQLPHSSLAKEGKSSGEIRSAREPLLNGVHDSESYSVSATILPFLFPALGGFLFGYDIGATSSATISIQSPTLSGISWYKLSSVEIGLLTSGSLYGALIGSVLAFNVADFLGRRRELITSALLYLVGAIVTAIAPNFPILVLGRIVFGIGIGLTGYGIGSLLVDTVAGWRYMFAASSPVAVIMGLGMWWLPASPRWLLLRAIQGKGDAQDLKDTAIRSLIQLHGQAICDSAPQQVDEILEELSCVGEEKEVTFGEMFQGKCLKALWIGAGLVLFQQITGQPSVLYYAASILQSAGFSVASDATRVSILLGFFKLIMTGVAVVVVDRLGRRPLLLGGVSGMVISLFLLGSYYIFLDNTAAVAVVGLLLYVGCYQISFGPIGWLMIAEIFPLRLRGRGLSIAVLVNFGANALVTFAFSPLEELLGAGILFYIFCAIAVASLVFIYLIVPETKGLTLEEIEAKCL
ncbi:D-xylose-proton symporter-like 2 isoform X3 [Abrus precatorius]|uniref:D-xylose-proton symporter-like 2 isoform X3 n=1 Tax=Abrus precatorius TaxID=3816 RepID=A0A8B8LIG6_ABRPR|nr:D-xylose-proton symporter-like 2 isoform X3 [Abrus precatorius]